MNRRQDTEVVDLRERALNRAAAPYARTRSIEAARRDVTGTVDAALRDVLHARYDLALRLQHAVAERLARDPALSHGREQWADGHEVGLARALVGLGVAEAEFPARNRELRRWLQEHAGERA